MEINLKNNLDHLYCNSDTNYLSRSEKKCLKNILLTHLDLIQEQNLQLLAKDNLIKELKKENDELKQRIQKLLKRSKSSRDYFSDLEVTKSKIKKTIIHPFQQQQNNRESQLNNSGELTPRKAKGGSQFNKSLRDSNNSKSLSEKIKNDQQMDTSEDEKRSGEDTKQQGSISIKLSSKNLFLNTTEEYTINGWKNLEFDFEEIQKTYNEDLNLETPGWSEKPLPELDDSMKHTDRFIEDISEEAYQKRHQKLEIDERRRKKWDVQRIREQKNIERLKKRHAKEEYAVEYGNDKLPKAITSFFPDIDTIKYIQITDGLLPVHAFGELIPKLQPKDFAYPSSNVYSAGNQNFSNSSSANDNIAPTIHLRTKFVYVNDQKKK